MRRASALCGAWAQRPSQWSFDRGGRSESNRTSMTAAAIYVFSGCVFLLGALLGACNGAIPLKSGIEISRHKDPLGFWMAVVCLAALVPRLRDFDRLAGSGGVRQALFLSLNKKGLPHPSRSFSEPISRALQARAALTGHDHSAEVLGALGVFLGMK